jgi:hypothetical protein
LATSCAAAKNRFRLVFEAGVLAAQQLVHQGRAGRGRRVAGILGLVEQHLVVQELAVLVPHLVHGDAVADVAVTRVLGQPGRLGDLLAAIARGVDVGDVLLRGADARLGGVQARGGNAQYSGSHGNLLLRLIPPPGGRGNARGIPARLLVDDFCHHAPAIATLAMTAFNLPA